ncbi:hypothetical protein EH2_01902 [Bacillus subtilis]|nr:hypothetical protein EH2_01902 [Bacillus subtilis]
MKDADFVGLPLTVLSLLFIRSITSDFVFGFYYSPLLTL